MTFTTELKALREKYGIRCETCKFFSTDRASTSCTLKMEHTSASGWCEMHHKEEPPAPEKPPCKGFHWLGQSMDHCDMCGKDISLHEGLSWGNHDAPLFGRDNGKPENIIPFDEARKRIPMFAHYVTPIGVPGDYPGPYRYDKPAEFWNVEGR